MNIIREVSKELKISEEDFRLQIIAAKSKINHVRIRKKGGQGFRKIYIPPWEFKLVQYWTILNYLKNFELHKSATAYYKGASIKENAIRHRGGNYFVRMDISDFFPSIGPEDLISTINKYYPNFKNLGADLQDKEFILAMFYEGKCAIGYPASPYISNIAMYSIDKEIESSLSDREDKFGKATYTRYADDITVSIEKKGHKKEIEEIITQAIKDSELKNLSINKKKTKYGSKRGGSSFVTGLRICKDGRLTLHRKYKDNVRLLLSLYSKGKLDREENSKLIGHLNHCKSVDPEFYNKLILKNFDSFLKLTKDYKS